MTQKAPQGIISASFIVLMVGNLSFFSSNWLIVPQLPAYVLELKGRESDIGLVLAAFAFTALAVRPFVGRFVDVFGQKRVAMFGGLMFIIAPAAYLLATAMPGLIVARMIHGLGLGLFTTATLAWVADLVPPTRRGEAMGLFATAGQTGLALAPLAGAAIYGAAGFNAMFIACAVTGAIVFLSATIARSSSPKGAAVSTGGRFSDALGRRDVMAMTFSLMAASACWGVLLSYLPILGARRNVGQTAIFFTIYAIAAITLRFPLGPLSDRVGRRVILAPCLAGLAACMIAFVGLSSQLYLVVLSVLCGLSLGPVYSTMSAFVVDVAPPRVRGSAIGVLTAGFDLGMVVGPYAGGLVAEGLGVEAAFIAAGLLCAAGVVVFVVGTKEVTSHPHDAVA